MGAAIAPGACPEKVGVDHVRTHKTRCATARALLSVYIESHSECAREVPRCHSTDGLEQLESLCREDQCPNDPHAGRRDGLERIERRRIRLHQH